jgi:hypothetical protein
MDHHPSAVCLQRRHRGQGTDLAAKGDQGEPGERQPAGAGAAAISRRERRDGSHEEPHVGPCRGDRHRRHSRRYRLSGPQPAPVMPLAGAAGRDRRTTDGGQHRPLIIPPRPSRRSPGKSVCLRRACIHGNFPSSPVRRWLHGLLHPDVRAASAGTTPRRRRISAAEVLAPRRKRAARVGLWMHLPRNYGTVGGRGPSLASCRDRAQSRARATRRATRTSSE